MNKYKDSEGNLYTQGMINSRLRDAYKWSMPKYICECCGKKQTNDHDHTISQSRCKELHKVELIWLEGNWSYSCRDCHHEWESYKSGLFSFHKNAHKRMLVVAMYDRETFIKRYHCITNEVLKDTLRNLYEHLTNE